MASSPTTADASLSPPLSSAAEVAERVPSALPSETIDQYALRLLEDRLAEPVDAEEPERRPNAGRVGPTQFELVYITGVGKQARALIRLDKKYAKLAGSGEALAGWTLSDIGADYVDIYKDQEQARVYLFSSRRTVRGL